MRPQVGVGGDERDWIDRLRTGDFAAFEALFGAYYEPLYRYVARTVSSREDAEEIVQDLFAVVWARRAELPTFRHGSTVRAYLYRAARNRIVNRARHAWVAKRLTAVDSEEDAPPGIARRPAAVDETIVTAERQVAVRRAVAALPSRLREVLALRTDHGMTYAEIASTLGVSVKTVEGHVTRAFRTLRRSLAHLVE